MQFVISNWKHVSIILHCCMLGFLLYGNYRMIKYIITERVLRRNLEDLYMNLQGIAEAREKSEAELQAMYGNRAKVSLIDKLDEVLKYSGISFKYEWLTTELCLVILAVSNAGLFVTVLIIKGFVPAIITCLAVDGMFSFYIARKRKKNYEDVEKSLIVFINTIDAYSLTTADLVTLLEHSINSVQGVLQVYIRQIVDNARSSGDLSQALSACEDRVEHPFLKMLLRNLNIASRNTANYGEIIRGCRQRLQEDLSNTQKMKAVYSSMRTQMMTLLIVGLLCIFVAANYVAKMSIVELVLRMQQSFIGMVILLYMLSIIAVLIYFAFIRQGKRE